MASKTRQKLEEIYKHVDFCYWVQNAGIVLDGNPFTFEGHEYLLDIYLDDHPRRVFKKGAQLGFSTMEVLSSLWYAKHRFPTGVLYLLPTKDDVTDFSKSKLNSLIDQNPQAVGQWVQSTDSTNIKKVGRGFIYLRGSRGRTGLKTISVDKVVFDEFDEMRPGAGAGADETVIKFDPITLARQRYAHSKFKHEDILSTPILPAVGVEAEFKKTDQRHWHITCRACNKDTCLELAFPDCLQPKGNKVIRACKHCGREIYPKDGQWVAHFPDRDVHGYYISQLNSSTIDPITIWEEFVSLEDAPPQQRQEFYNSRLGIGWVEAQNRLEQSQIYSLCGHQPVVYSSRAPCCMGIDQNPNELHVVVGQRTGEREYNVLHIGRYRQWEDLDELFSRFNVPVCVIDAMPEQRSAFNFARRHPGHVYLCYYFTRLKGGFKWDDAKLTVQVNRTESLDNSHDVISRGLVSFPRRNEEMEMFARECTNTAKQLNEDPKTGSREYEYVKLGSDHYRHAFNYMIIAAERMPVTSKARPSILEDFRKPYHYSEFGEGERPLAFCYH